MFKTSLSFKFFSVILIGWKKFATLLPKNWLAETPQALASMRLGRQSAERERVSENQLEFFKRKTEGKLAFLRIYVQSERELNLSLFLFLVNLGIKTKGDTD